MSQPAFLSEIMAAPEQDEPRLIYADWLAERGNPRGEFIQAQCHLASLDAASPQRPRLEARQAFLWRQYARHWTLPIRKFTRQVGFERGFADFVRLSSRQLLANHQQFERYLISGLTVSPVTQPLETLCQLPAWRQLTGLGLGHCTLPGSAIAKSFSLPERLHSLSLSHPVWLDALAIGDTLGGNAGLVKIDESILSSLDIKYALRDGQQLLALLSRASLPQLRRLCLGPLPQGDCPIKLPWELSQYMPQLRHLEMEMCHLGAEEIRDLFHRDTPSPLEVLSLARNPLHWQGIHSLRRYEGLNRLAVLDISSCNINARGFSLLAKTPSLSQLVRLRARDNLIDARSAKSLIESPYLQQLRELSVRGTQVYRVPFQLRDEGAEVLLAEGTLPKLGSLDLSRNGLAHRTVQMLSDNHRLSQLFSLDLSQNHLGDIGASILAEYGSWHELSWLNVQHNDISPHMRRRLRQVFGHRICC